MNKSNGSSGSVWGCIGTVGAALVTGIFGLIAILLTNPDFLSNRLGLGGAQATATPTVEMAAVETPTIEIPTLIWSTSTPDTIIPVGTLTLPEIDWTQLFQLGDGTPEPPPSSSLMPNLPGAPPATSGCPVDVQMQWLTFTNTWYGPYDIYYVSYDYSNFYVWDPDLWNPVAQNFGNWYYFSSLPVSSARNTWQPLLGTSFWVCIDAAGYVYSVYSP